MTSTSNCVCEDLPVAIVNSWDEVTLENVLMQRQRFQLSFDSAMFARLTIEYRVERTRKSAAADQGRTP